MRNPADYRKGVGIMLLNKDNKVFVGQRIDKTSESWQMPQGGIDNAETPIQACMRELEEEVGTCNAEIVHEHPEWLFYDLPQELAARLWKGRYKGQMQKWFALKFMGDDSDINIKTKNPEFMEWKWADINEVPELIVEFKKELYQQVHSKFYHLFEDMQQAAANS